MSEEGGYYEEGAATLGDRIAAARSAAGLTQTGLASRLGVGAKVVSAWEHDRSEPRANRLAMLSGLLSVSVSWLLTGVGDGVAPPNEREAEIGPRKIELVLGVPDLGEARVFFVDLLGSTQLEATEDSAVFEFFGHRVLAECGRGGSAAGVEVRVRLGWSEWRTLVERVRAANADFMEAPTICNVGAPSEEGAFALTAPGGVVLGFRSDHG